MGKIQLRTGDLVEIIAGNDIGKTGKIMRIDRKRGRVFVEGVNMMKKHKRANQQNNQPGGIIEHEGPIDPSNVKKIQ